LVCIAMLAFAATAHAQSGGTPPPGSVPSPSPTPTPPPTTTGSWTLMQKATWYGPGFWGNETACGMPLEKGTLGAAHKKLPCGTQVTFTYNGVSTSATVIDRGPYHKGYKWDLTKRTAKQIGFLEVGAGVLQATVTPVAAAPTP
jgi:rare lipoprotein A (peptidoglycan hydrolase)